MDRPSLAQFFRTSDHSTEIVGVRQAGTFRTLRRSRPRRTASSHSPRPDQEGDLARAEARLLQGKRRRPLHRCMSEAARTSA